MLGTRYFLPRLQREEPARYSNCAVTLLRKLSQKLCESALFTPSPYAKCGFSWRKSTGQMGMTVADEQIAIELIWRGRRTEVGSDVL